MGLGLENKVVLVTGAGSGIGRAAALKLGAHGANVALADIDGRAAEAACAAVKGAGARAVWRRTDVAKADEVEKLVAFALDTFGRLDSAVNNAGIQGELATTLECSEENWDRIMGVNLKGVWLCMKYEIRAMLSQSRGAIVNVASNFGLVGSQRMPAYSASKHGVIGLTKTAAIEFASAGIRINAVCPGPTMTPLVEAVVRNDPEIVDGINSRMPAGRMARAEEVADAIVWLCSDDAGFVIGSTLSVDGGYVAQ